MSTNITAGVNFMLKALFPSNKMMFPFKRDCHILKKIPPQGGLKNTEKIIQVWLEEGGAVPKTTFFINTLVDILNTCTSLVRKFFETPTGGDDVSHPALHFMEEVLFSPKGLTKNGSWLEAARKVNPENAMLSSFSTAWIYATKRGVRSERLVAVRRIH